MARGSPSDHILEFIESIPDGKLMGTFGGNGTKVYADTDYRLDMQNMTTERDGKGIRFNLQVQVNKGCKKRSVARLAPGTVAWVLIPVDETWTPDQIRKALKDTVTGRRVDPPAVAK